jgi:hypothetical protein
MSMRPLLRVSILVVAGWLGSAGAALADAVTHWNAITQAAIAAGRPGPIGTLDAALVQGAVYDAVQSIKRKFKAYHIRIDDAPRWASADAAAAAAAHGVLVFLYETQETALNDALAAYLADNDLEDDPGIGVGEEVAEAYQALYRANPPPPLPVFRGCDDTPPCQAGEWRPTQNHLPTLQMPPFAPMTTPWLGAMDPFTLISGNQFRAPAPPSLTSRRYRRDYDEVKALGSIANMPCVDCGRFEDAFRTPDQTTHAYFWSENFIRQWNEVARQLAEKRHLKIADSSRLLALVGFALADAAIHSWNNKRHYNFWRPVTAIQEGDIDGNPDTFGDPAWRSLINTPPYPDQTSGANTLSGAATRALALFFGTDHVTFTVTNIVTPQLGTELDPALNPNRRRTFHRFSDAAQEVVDARVLLGIHFRYADEDGRKAGQRIAQWAFKHFLRPVKHRGHHGRHHWDGDDCDRD